MRTAEPINTMLSTDEKAALATRRPESSTFARIAAKPAATSNEPTPTQMAISNSLFTSAAMPRYACKTLHASSANAGRRHHALRKNPTAALPTRTGRNVIGASRSWTFCATNGLITSSRWGGEPSDFAAPCPFSGGKGRMRMDSPRIMGREKPDASPPKVSLNRKHRRGRKASGGEIDEKG